MSIERRGEVVNLAKFRQKRERDIVMAEELWRELQIEIQERQIEKDEIDEEIALISGRQQEIERKFGISKEDQARLIEEIRSAHEIEGGSDKEG